jgi:hypothetical protein
MRINALLTSQSFFMIAGAILYTNLLSTLTDLPQDANGKRLASPALPELPPDAVNLVSAIAFVALLTASFAGIAIAIGCQVISQWHSLGATLKSKRSVATLDEAIDGCYLPRNLPDWQHILSIDLFGVTLPLIFMAFWAIVLWWLEHPYLFLIGLIVASVSALVLVWRLMVSFVPCLWALARRWFRSGGQ